MCGIVGINQYNKSFINNSLKLMKHRGPDANGVFFSKDISLGHLRLSIIDLSEKGKQPMFSKDKKISIIFNGEIYNYKKIKKILLDKSHKFESDSDTEVIINAYIEWGEKCVDYFEGMWAFCIYDKNKNSLFLSRDRFGEKPLYFYNKNGLFAFASEIKCFMRENLFNLSISEEQIDHFLIFSTMSPGKSIFNEISKLNAGSNLIYDLKSKKLYEKKYFDIKKISNKKTLDFSGFSKKFEIAFNESVKDKLNSDVPLGAFLSGGLDSSGLVLYSKRYKKIFRTFSITFKNKKYNESKYSKFISKKLNTIHKNINLENENLIDYLEDFQYFYDEPYGNSSALPTMAVSKLAREKLTVALSGDGADEFFSGYDNFQKLKLLSYQKYIPKLIRKKIKYKLENSKNKKNKKLSNYILEGDYSREVLLERIYKIMQKNQFELIRNKNYSFNDFKKYSKYDNSSTIFFYEIENFLVENVLVKTDRASMRYSLELRCPFLSKDIAFISRDLKESLKSNIKTNKIALKKFFEKDFPKNFIYRKKQGFASPVEEFLNNELKEHVDKYVLNYDKHNYFNNAYMRKLIGKHRSNEENNYKVIWKILIFNMWYDYWIINNKDINLKVKK
jgi:asparagine synthase (glutamine-hydrolysing)